MMALIYVNVLTNYIGMWSLNKAAGQILVLSIFTIISNKFTSPLVNFEGLLNCLITYCFKEL